MKRPSSKPVVFEGTHYPSIVDLCRAYRVNYGTYWSRKKKGWTDREALEIDERKLVNGNAKSYVVYGRSFASQIEVCAAYDVPTRTYHGRPRRGCSQRAALGLDARKNISPTAKPVEFEGKGCPIRRHIYEGCGVSESTYLSRRNAGWRHLRERPCRLQQLLRLTGAG